MNPADAVPFALVVLVGTAVGAGGLVVWLVISWNRRFTLSTRIASRTPVEAWHTFRQSRPSNSRRTKVWLAIRSRNLQQVLDVLGLSDPTPCAWDDGIAEENSSFIAPPIRGWILVVGAVLPNPADDVDACFQFLVGLSRKLGHVQIFQADSIVQHHAWVKIEAGRVIRAYAWADTSNWNQGVKTAAEIALGLKCFGYGEETGSAGWDASELLTANLSKVPLLAAHWSLDPGELERIMPPHARGIVGKPSTRY